MSQEPVKIIVEVEGGCVTDVYSTGNVPIEYDIIDHDDMIECRECGEKFDSVNVDGYCNTCRLTVED